MTTKTVDTKTDLTATTEGEAVTGFPQLISQRIADKLPLPELKVDVKAETARALYAYAGAGDLAVEYVKETVTGAGARANAAVVGAQKDVQAKAAGVRKGIAGVEKTPAGVVGQATTLVGRTTERVGDAVESLGQELQSRRDSVVAKVTEKVSALKAYPVAAKSAVGARVDTVSTVYRDLAERGEGVVARVRPAKTTAEPVAKSDEKATPKPAEKVAEKVAGKPSPKSAEKAVSKSGTRTAVAKPAAAKPATAKKAAPTPKAPKPGAPGATAAMPAAPKAAAVKPAAPKSAKSAAPKAASTPSAPLPAAPVVPDVTS